ncbi:hypothetical protein REPUB_Repub06bG0065200 [Reevesia pubescens]
MNYEYEEQINKLQADSKYHRYHFLKKTLQLVVSVALLSFLLCHSSGFSLFPHSFNVYFSTFLFSFFTHTLERKYMFLIRNGILAFLAKSSIPSSSSPSESAVGAKVSTSSTNLTQTKTSVINEVDGDYDHVPLVAEGEEVQDTCKNEVEEQAGQEESEVSVIVGNGDEEEYKEGESAKYQKKEEGESAYLVKQEEQEEQEEGVGAAAIGANEEVPSTEELNRKFEEFIRKMKEEIRIEAQQQLIAV